MTTEEFRNKVSKTLSAAQQGLMYMPLHGVFVLIRLRDRNQGAVTGALGALQESADTLTSQGTRSAFVAAFNPDLWASWTGSMPDGAPGADSILGRSAHSRNTYGNDDVFLF